MPRHMKHLGPTVPRVFCIKLDGKLYPDGGHLKASLLLVNTAKILSGTDALRRGLSLLSARLWAMNVNTAIIGTMQ